MDFVSLDEIYLWLESVSFDTVDSFEITRVIKRFADKTTDEPTREKAKWECFAFDFHLIEGEAKPIHSSVKEDGTTLYGYPSYEDFGDNGLNYLKLRAKQVKSIYLIALYNQILWNSPKPHKHYQYAKEAANAYLQLLTTLNCYKEERHGARNCLELMKNGFSLAIQSKSKVEDYKSLIHFWLFEKGKFPNDSKIIIIDYLLSVRQLKKSDFTGYLELVVKLGKSHKKKKTDYFSTKYIYETGLKIAQRVGSDTKVWNKRIGDAIVNMADHRMDDESRMVPLSFLKEAIHYYKLAGLNNKIREIEQRYFELKKELRLSKVELPLNDEASEKFDSYLRNKVDNLMKYSSDEIFGYIITGNDIFPKKSWLIEMGKNRDSAFLDFATTMRFDINNNLSKHKETKEEKAAAKIYENYHFYLQLSVSPWLHRIFIEGIKSGKITYSTLAKFIYHHTWLGQEFTDFDAGGELIKYNWISVIAPSLHEYFLQIESALKSNNPYTNFIMPIDSLTLKFEGLLRDFLRILNVSTTTTGKGGVLREKYIEELLQEQKIQELFDEDDILFFKFLFVAKDGMNLRNNIAHCFYRFHSYNFQIVHLLICAFLRIGKYKLTKKS